MVIFAEGIDSFGDAWSLHHVNPRDGEPSAELEITDGGESCRAAFNAQGLRELAAELVDMAEEMEGVFRVG